MEQKPTIKKSAYQAGKNLWYAFPILIALLLLISILSQILTKEFYSSIFTGSLLDPLIGSIIGSISMGAPIISYIIGGEMMNQGVSLIAITAFIISWVSVGVFTFPVEAHYLGKKFAFVRNFLSFIFSIIVAITTVTILNLI
ncbi:hypothetical protein GOV13_04935 [Candidatus Pacearchaeota archaeon]|nr:hypothetical protein [Candidatus Pacearchaeota archaeon]